MCIRDSSESDQADLVKDADFIISYRFNPVDSVIRSAKKCKLLQLLAAGYDSVNLGLIREMGIPCSNNGGANSWAVSDHAVLLMLSLYKKIIDSDNSTRLGTWKKPINGENTFEMANKKVGILGIGNIGKKVAKRVQAFDSIAQYYDLFPLDNQLNSQLSLKSVSLDELFETLTLIQTGHMRKVPVVLVGAAYWGGMLNWIEETMLKSAKNISPEERSNYYSKFAQSVIILGKDNNGKEIINIINHNVYIFDCFLKSTKLIFP